jgi:isoleucyl-tRNA synthetase
LVELCDNSIGHRASGIIGVLKKKTKFKVEKYVHSYPHCWRTDKPILYYPLDSWFIKISEVKDRMFDLNEPSTGSQKQLEKVVLELVEKRK